MSIAVLNQVYDEASRLAVAGSVVAHGDFRLKKLLAPLDAAGAKAPVFAKVADCVRAVVEGPEDKSAESLLELTSIVSAVLYTQGETGLAGKLERIETTDFGGAMVQTSARLLKPLLEALTSTGSGRIELVKDAFERGAFRDLRLVKAALAGLDDPYSEIAEFLMKNVLPTYGKSILQELRNSYDPKGTKGHPRRLKLLHNADPAGARELVMQALDVGSKEVRVAAIGCLRAKEDLSFLIEQASAKAQDVREAAYQSLSTIDEPEAVALFAKAISGKDHPHVIQSIVSGKSEKLAALLIAEVRNGVAELPKLKDKKIIAERAKRVTYLLRALPDKDHPATDALLLELFKNRAEIAKVKGENYSGADVVETVIHSMSNGSKSLQLVLAHAHAEFDADGLMIAVRSGEECLTAAGLYEQFSPYLTAKTDAKKKGKDSTIAKRDAVIHTLGGYRIYWYAYQDDKQTSFDPRWLDLAVKIQNVGLVNTMGRPNHPAAEAFLKAEFDAKIKSAQAQTQLQELVHAMTRHQHPYATDALLAAVGKISGKNRHELYYYIHIIPILPKAAIPQLEAFVPTLKDGEADRWLEAIQELRVKK